MLTSIRRHWLLVSVAVAVLAMLVFGPTLYAKFSTAGQRYSAQTQQLSIIPERRVGLVFGAGVRPDRTPTEYLRNRVETGVALYKTGRVDHLLMSGDNSSDHYDEPTVMKELAVKLGVPDKDITIDYAGYSTYDSCYRARNIFGVRSAAMVTQGYHLPRTVMTCRAFGIDTIGVAATHQGRDWGIMYIVREYISTLKALIQTTFKPQPTVLGKSEPIDQ